MAGLFRANIRHLHEALEIPAAAQARPRLEIRAQEVADRRDRLQNRTALLSLLEIIVQELNSDWIANGRLMGKLGDKISPLNLLEVTEFENGGDLHGAKETIDKDLLAGGLLLIYRCIGIPPGGYEHDFLTTLMTTAKVVFPKSPFFFEYPRKNAQAQRTPLGRDTNSEGLEPPKKPECPPDPNVGSGERLRAIIACIPRISAEIIPTQPQGIEIPPFPRRESTRNNYQSWDQDPGFRIIVAALDMFLVKFPNHPQSKLRMGTIPSRWRDCLALKNIYEILERYTLDKLIVLLSWCWEDALFPEIESIWAKDISSYGQPDGYFPYMADFGFVSRSPYSTTSNPAIHLFISTLFACLGDKRGYNSRFIPCPAPTGVVDNAFIMAYAFTKDKR
ncbi:hypothetical protein RUM43_002465 [Polyplax serrata]|uniref:Rhabdovirus nucleocapsid domain-containing protein n=1 Tax=Polyplax serrata TaxID=468196 RepID=A0AAN8NUP5_POLSC